MSEIERWREQQWRHREAIQEALRPECPHHKSILRDEEDKQQKAIWRDRNGYWYCRGCLQALVDKTKELREENRQLKERIKELEKE